MPCHQFRFNPVWRRIGGGLRSGAIGRWHLVEVSVHRAGADPGQQGADEALPWRVRRADAGGGVLLDHGTHLLYTLLDLAGTLPARVSAWTGRLAHAEYEVEDTAEVRLEYPDAHGDRVTRLFCTWADRRRETRVHVVGERGAVRWTDGTLTLERDGATESHDVSRELDKAAYAGWFAELFEDFVGVLDAGAGSEAAERALEAQLRAIEAGRYGPYKHPTFEQYAARGAGDEPQTGAQSPYLQGAFVALDPRTGAVRALVGGRDFDDSKFNRATQALRQPGSSFKPIVYAAAVQNGRMPSTPVDDDPITLGDWSPKNFDGKAMGIIQSVS